MTKTQEEKAARRRELKSGFSPAKSNNQEVALQNTLLFGPPGVGKTTQAVFMQKKFGKTLILSGEAGLSSLNNDEVDYMEFQRDIFERGIDEDGNSTGFPSPRELKMQERNNYSFEMLLYYLKNFAKEDGYKVIVIDSLTELSRIIFNECSAKYHHAQDKTGAIYQAHNKRLLEIIVAIRDLTYCHVLFLALDNNGKGSNDKDVSIIPNVMGKKVTTNLAGIFDNVWGFYENQDPESPSELARYVVTSSVNGWQCKTRDPNRPSRLRSIEPCNDITKLIEVMSMSGDEFASLEAKRKKETPKQTEAKGDK